MTPTALVLPRVLLILAATQSEAARSVFNKLIGDPRHADAQTVTPEIREEVLMYLRRYADGADPDSGIKSGGNPSETAKLLLLRLEDQEAITQLMKERRDSKVKFGYSGVPDPGFLEFLPVSIIPELSEDFYLEDGNEVTSRIRGGDVLWLEARPQSRRLFGWLAL